MKEKVPYCSVEEASALIDCCLARNLTFYACRYPNEVLCRFGAQVSSRPSHNATNGFRVVPFDVKGAAPLFTIHPEYTVVDFEKLQAMPVQPVYSLPIEGDDVDLSTYRKEADALIEAMKRGEMSKVVLSRTITHACEAHLLMPQYFERLCASYPSAYVFIVYYPGVCAWVGATPEVLLSSHATGYTTMALAGTRLANVSTEWGEKESEEQQYVAQYIADILKDQGLMQVKQNTYTHKAGKIEHLCTHFDITTPHDSVVRDALVAALHPTPAVAGTPTARAIEAIKHTEPHSRRYYGGYVGECSDDGCCGFFVNLRCMEFWPTAVRLYVGGGLTARSVALDEWGETCAKSQTLMSVLNR